MGEPEMNCEINYFTFESYEYAPYSLQVLPSDWSLQMFKSGPVPCDKQ